MYKLTKDQLEALIYDARNDLKQTAGEIIAALPQTPPSTKILIRKDDKTASMASAEIEGKNYTKVFGQNAHELIGKVVLSYENYFSTKVEWV